MQAAQFQEIQGIQLLSMHKPASPEGHYFSEGEFFFRELTGENPNAFRTLTFPGHLGVFFTRETEATRAVMIRRTLITNLFIQLPLQRLHRDCSR